ncbi:hypothetical protein [Deinococcus frigens]|uniref:hypothetical protein n=1 Tax=Deinococcus frigens TaxID=249403 RepID=UPI00054D04EF|nr:hypothetical protein [Deinococcus frigens]
MTVTAKKPKSETPSTSPRRVGIKEFKDRATQLLAADEPFVVERHGKPVGFYTPIVAANAAQLREAQDIFNTQMEELAAKLGLSVEALEDELFGPDSAAAPAGRP